MQTKVIRSSRRKRTIQASICEGMLVVRVPAGLSAKEEEKYVEQMKMRVEASKLRNKISDDYLMKRFNNFNKKYFESKLKVNQIKFSNNQKTIRGSCTPTIGSIRISDDLLDMPKWVLDYVIIHEMTHLIYPNHSKAFWKKVNEYKFCERARGYLIAKETQ